MSSSQFPASSIIIPSTFSTQLSSSLSSTLPPSSSSSTTASAVSNQLTSNATPDSIHSMAIFKSSLIPNYQCNNNNIIKKVNQYGQQPLPPPTQTTYITNTFGNNADLGQQDIKQPMIGKYPTSNLPSSLPQPVVRHTGYQQLPKGSSPATTTNGFNQEPLKYHNGYNNTSCSGLMNKDEVDIVTEMNKLYKKSPFVQRKQTDFNNGAVYGESPKKESILSSFVRNITTSPFSQKKIQNQPEGFWNLSNPPDGGGGPAGHYGNGYNNHNHYRGDDIFIRDSASPSPIGTRKRFQTTVPILNDNTPQYSRLQGNTSPIVLQRFYHQQNQLREREREKHELKYQMQTELNTAVNPFLNSFIPKYHPSHQIPSQIPMQQHQQTTQHQFSSQMNQSESPVILNDNYSINYQQQQHQQPNHYHSSNIPVYSQHSNAKKQFLLNNKNQTDDRHTETTQQLDGNYMTSGHANGSSGYGTHNNYSKNIYGRTMTQAKTSQQLTSNDSPNLYKDEGWFNSLAGAVKRQFASYVKLHLTQGDKQHHDTNKDQNTTSIINRNSRATNHSNITNINNIPSNNQISTELEDRFRQHHNNVQSSIIQPPNPHVLSGNSAMARHRSPDPPPRYNRGQSPLLLRKNLLELSGQVPSGSPLLQRRYVTASPPLPPPRRGSESVPGSPQHLRTRIHYTPEPQRRMYRTIDQ